MSPRNGPYAVNENGVKNGTNMFWETLLYSDSSTEVKSIGKLKAKQILQNKRKTKQNRKQHHLGQNRTKEPLKLQAVQHVAKQTPHHSKEHHTATTQKKW